MLCGGSKKPEAHQGKWNGLGGKIESGETPEECIIREVKEESGLTIKNPKLVGIITFPSFALSKESWYAYVFVATEFEGTVTESAEGKLEWIDNDKILSLNTWDGDKVFLCLLDSPTFWSAKIQYNDEGKLESHSVVFHK